jgi:hypothetical protein
MIVTEIEAYQHWKKYRKKKQDGIPKGALKCQYKSIWSGFVFKIYVNPVTEVWHGLISYQDAWFINLKGEKDNYPEAKYNLIDKMYNHIPAATKEFMFQLWAEFHRMAKNDDCFSTTKDVCKERIKKGEL